MRNRYAKSMSGAVIPHSVNPGPQLTCAVCGLLRSGSDFASDDDNAPCRSCRDDRKVDPLTTTQRTDLARTLGQVEIAIDALIRATTVRSRSLPDGMYEALADLNRAEESIERIRKTLCRTLGV